MNSKKELVEKPKAKSKAIVVKPKAKSKVIVVKPKAVAKPKATKKDLVVKPKAVAKAKATKKDLVEKPKAVAKAKAVEKPKATKKVSVNTLKKKGGTGNGIWADTKKAFSDIKEGVKEFSKTAKRAFSGNSDPSAISDKLPSNTVLLSPVFDQQNDSDETNIQNIIEIVKKAKKELNDLLKKINQMELSATVLNNDRKTIIKICDECKKNYLVNQKNLFDYIYSYDIYINEINLKSKIKATDFESSNKNKLKILIEIFDLSKAIRNHYDNYDIFDNHINDDFNDTNLELVIDNDDELQDSNGNEIKEMEEMEDMKEIRILQEKDIRSQQESSNPQNASQFDRKIRPRIVHYSPPPNPRHQDDEDDED
jgi:hypothetical protein